MTGFEDSEREHIADLAFREDVDGVRELLLLGWNPDEPNERGHSAMNNAIQAGNVQIVEMLLEAGADPNGEDSRGWTPIYRTIIIETDAASQSDVKAPSTAILEVLLKHGADPNQAVTSPSIYDRVATPLALAGVTGNLHAEAVLRRAGATH